MYQNYIFDLYGTLLDIHTDEEKEELWLWMAECYEKEGAVYTPKELRKAYEDGCKNAEENLRRKKKIEYPEIEIGEVFFDLFLRKGAKVTWETVVRVSYQFRKLSREYMALYEETEHLLQELKAEGKKVYLLSNAQRLFTVTEIKEVGIGKYFDDIFISSDYGMKKPERVYMEALIAKHGLKKEECLMIGNEVKSDIAVADRCSVDSVLVMDGEFLNVYREMDIRQNR